MKIAGIQKLSLLDFPDKMSCLVFTQGCNIRCPFCHNSSIIDFNYDNCMDEKEVFAYLKKRKGILEGVVISGGEPTLQKDLKDFIIKVREMGYSIKLDTNGCNPKILKELLDENLLDYVAMDIKNEVETCKYSKTCGLAQMRVDNILESINILKNSKIDYEFRTTITKELHDIDSIRHILDVIGNQPKYFLQNFRLSENVLDKNMHGFSIEELRNLEHTLNVDYKNVKVRDLYEEKGEEIYV